MTCLVVKEKIRLELTQKFALGQAAQEHGFVDLDVPIHQRAYGPLMRRGAARGDERGANAHAAAGLALQALQGQQQRLERPCCQGVVGLRALVGLKGIQAT